MDEGHESALQMKDLLEMLSEPLDPSFDASTIRVPPLVPTAPAIEVDRLRVAYVANRLGSHVREVRPMALGIFGGTMFALSAIGYRGAILALEHPSFVMTATFTLAVGLILQAASLSAFLAWRDMDVLLAIFRAWKPSLLAGFMGAFASQFWFLAFAIATAASVRTLALVEVLMAQAVSKFIFKQPTTPREAVGIVMIVIGVVVLVWAH